MGSGSAWIGGRHQRERDSTGYQILPIDRVVQKSKWGCGRDGVGGSCVKLDISNIKMFFQRNNCRMGRGRGGEFLIPSKMISLAVDKSSCGLFTLA